MDKKETLTGLDLMLKRMETHPEEFVGVNGGCSRDWYNTINPVIPYLTDEERGSIDLALRKAYREHFTGEVMRVIAGERVVNNDDKYTVDSGYTRSLADRLRPVPVQHTETLTGAIGSTATVEGRVSSSQ